MRRIFAGFSRQYMTTVRKTWFRGAQPLDFLGRIASYFFMRRTLGVFLFMVIWLAVTIAALILGLPYNWPDNTHVDYGLPLTWATNTTSTIVGPVNLWSVNLFNLFVDLVFWLGIMIAIVAVMLYKTEP